MDQSNSEQYHKSSVYTLPLCSSRGSFHCQAGDLVGRGTSMEGRAQGNGQRVILLDGDDLEGVVPGPWTEQQLHSEPFRALNRHPVCKS